MAGRAILIELRQLMVRLGCLIVIGLVTGITCGRCTGVLSGMTGYTGCLEMRAGQRERGRVMVVLCGDPGIDTVAQRTIVREAAGLMVRLNG